MDIANYIDLFNELRWLLSLGYVTLIATVFTILLVQLFKVTILKKCLLPYRTTIKDKNAKEVDKVNASHSIDKILGFTGTIVSLVLFTIVHFANEMILQGKFMIDFNKVTQSISIPAGASITWVAAKGLYTVFHKWIGRIKDKKAHKLHMRELYEDIKHMNSGIKDEVDKHNSKDAVDKLSKDTGVKVKKIL